jgi:hypothetical protein
VFVQRKRFRRVGNCFAATPGASIDARPDGRSSGLTLLVECRSDADVYVSGKPTNRRRSEESSIGAKVMLRPMPTLDRLTLATKFVAALHDVSQRNPAEWRRISAIGARMGIKGAQLDQVVADVVNLGLVKRRVDDPSFVTLTNEGWAIAKN